MIISLYNINWLVFITETECVYCAVRTGSLYVMRFSLSLQRPCHGSGGQSPQSTGCDTRSVFVRFVVDIMALGTAFFSEYVAFAPSVSFHKCAILIFCILLLPEGETGKAGNLS